MPMHRDDPSDCRHMICSLPLISQLKYFFNILHAPVFLIAYRYVIRESSTVVSENYPVRVLEPSYTAHISVNRPL